MGWCAASATTRGPINPRKRRSSFTEHVVREGWYADYLASSGATVRHPIPGSGPRAGRIVMGEVVWE